MRAYQRLTDEEIIQRVHDYMEKYPNAGRNKIILNATGCAERVRKLESEGRITLPKPLPLGSKSNWAKYFTMDRRETNAIKKAIQHGK